MASKAKRTAPIYWGEAIDGRRRRWTIWLDRPGEGSHLGSDASTALHGAADLERRRIYVNGDSPRKTWQTTLLHELMHAGLDDTVITFNEKLIEIASTHLFPILRSLGFRFPRPPRIPWRAKRRRS